MSVIFFAANSVFHARIKHIELDYHSAREKLVAKQLSIHFVCSDDHIANIFTKSLAKSCFYNLRSKITVCSALLSLRGCVGIEEMNSSDDENGEHDKS
jgi:hypothetical protein